MSTLPPLPDPGDEKIHVITDAGKQGPLSRQALKFQVGMGSISKTHRFWYTGMDEWEIIGEHPALLDLDVVGAVPEASPSAPEPAPVPAPTPAPESAPASAPVGDPEAVAAAMANDDPVVMGSVGDFSAHVEPGSAEDNRLDGIFGDLVTKSWDYYEDHAFSGHIDEVFLGAIITSTLDSGCALIDISSDGTHHYLRFEDLEDHSRIVYRMTHLTGSLSQSRVLGQRASVVVGYGERVGAFQKIWKALEAEYKSGLVASPEPGTITVDGDMKSGYVYVQVDLFLCIDDYVGRDYTIDYKLLQDHLAASHNALRKYLRGRFA
jgi:hypothetical protein